MTAPYPQPGCGCPRCNVARGAYTLSDLHAAIRFANPPPIPW